MLKHVKTILLVTWAGTTHAWIRFHHYYRNLPETGWGSPKFNGLALCFLKNWLIYFWNPFPMGASLRSSGPPLPCEALSACGNSRDLSNETVASIMGIFLDTLYVLIHNVYIYICIWLYEYVYIYICIMQYTVDCIQIVIYIYIYIPALLHDCLCTTCCDHWQLFRFAPCRHGFSVVSIWGTWKPPWFRINFSRQIRIDPPVPCVFYVLPSGYD